MVEWSNEALEAAWNAMFVEPFDGTQAPMIGAALDAAVKAQWGSVPSVGYLSGFDAGRIQGRADAFEEAAKIVVEEAEVMLLQRDDIIQNGTLEKRPVPERFKQTYAYDRRVLAEGYGSLAVAIRNLAKEGK